MFSWDALKIKKFNQLNQINQLPKLKFNLILSKKSSYEASNWISNLNWQQAKNRFGTLFASHFGEALGHLT